jgi:hypothetical protein
LIEFLIFQATCNVYAAQGLPRGRIAISLTDIRTGGTVAVSGLLWRPGDNPAAFLCNAIFYIATQHNLCYLDTDGCESGPAGLTRPIKPMPRINDVAADLGAGNPPREDYRHV